MKQRYRNRHLKLTAKSADRVRNSGGPAGSALRRKAQLIPLQTSLQAVGSRNYLARSRSGAGKTTTLRVGSGFTRVELPKQQDNPERAIVPSPP